MKKFLAIALAAAMVLALAGCQNGGQKNEEWPKKPITIVVGYTAGGDYDVNARAYAEELKKKLGVDVVVQNVAGSGGTVAAEQVKNSANDGYTVFFHQPALLISRLQGLIDFGVDAYEMACMAMCIPGDLMCVNKSMGISTFKEFEDYVKAHPGEVNVAATAGTMNYIQCLQMQSLGLQINIVDGGNATERVANLLGGHVDVILNSYGTVKDYIKTGDFIALATLAHERAEAYPDIPTAIEQGYEVYFDKYGYFVFPKGTDAKIVEKFSNTIKEISESESYKKTVWDSFGMTPFYANAQDTLKIMDDLDKMLQNYKDQLSQK